MPPELWAHQRDALAFAQGKPGVLLGLPMSAGKGAVAIQILRQRGCRRVLVLCPLSVLGVWPREIQVWEPDTAWTVWTGQVTGLRGKPKTHPTVADRARILREHAAASHDRLMICVHYDICWREPMLTALRDMEFDAVIFDESHRIQSPSGKASKAARRLAKETRARGGTALALTGTPLGNDGMALWAQLDALDQAIFGTSFVRFRARYAKPKIRANGYPMLTPHGTPIWDGLDPSKENQLVALASRVMFTVPAAEIDRTIGLKDPHERTWTCEPDTVTRRAHDDMERHGIALVESGIINAANAMVALLRMAQITAGAAAVEDGPDRTLHDDVTQGPKARLLHDLLADIGPEPIVVFCRFRHDLRVVREVADKLGRRYGELSGLRKDALDNNARLADGLQVAAVQLKSGGVGIDLTRARHAVYYSLDFSLTDHQQSRKRVHRHGQDRAVYLHQLVVKDTVDEVIAGALRAKGNAVDSLIYHLSREVRPDASQNAA